MIPFFLSNYRNGVFYEFRGHVPLLFGPLPRGTRSRPAMSVSFRTAPPVTIQNRSVSPTFYYTGGLRTINRPFPPSPTCLELEVFLLSHPPLEELTLAGIEYSPPVLGSVNDPPYHRQ